MHNEGNGDQGLRQQTVPVMDLKKGFFFLAAFAGGLLRRFIARHLFIKITFTLTAGNPLTIDAVDTKIFSDKIPVDLVFDDQAPFAEGLEPDQQDQ